jgi:hypothetical protein
MEIASPRHTGGRATVFGVDDELTLHIEGTCPGRIATYTATAEQAPGLVLQGTLIRNEKQPSAPELAKLLATFDPDRLPKLTKRFR